MYRNPPANAGDMGSIPGLGKSHMEWNNQAQMLQLLKPVCLKPVQCNEGSHLSKQPAHRDQRKPAGSNR